MDNWNYVFGYAMERAMTMMAYCMVAAVVEKTLEAERRKVKEALGHEPTWENWQYYYDLQQEEKNRRNTRQQDTAHKNLCCLVFGEGDSNTESS